MEVHLSPEKEAQLAKLATEQGRDVDALAQQVILLNVIYDGQQCTHFLLAYSVLIVRVQGRNLQKLVYAIENEMADYIQEFDPDRWGKPKGEMAAFIESIEIKVVEGSSPFDDTKH